MVDVNKAFTQIETCFNVAGSLPIISLVSASIRSMAAQVQVVAGAVFGLIGFLGHLVSNNPKWVTMGQMGVSHIIHGAANFGRSIVELFLGTLFVGSLFLFVYQIGSSRQFAPIISYTSKQPEESAPHVGLNP